MKVIRDIIKSMKKRLAQAECDIDLALKYKTEYPDLAKNQYTISVETMNQFRTQHDMIASLIADYQKQGNEVPESMQTVYDYVHEEYMEYAAEIKAKQEMFK